MGSSTVSREPGIKVIPMSFTSTPDLAFIGCFLTRPPRSSSARQTAVYCDMRCSLSVHVFPARPSRTGIIREQSASTAPNIKLNKYINGPFDVCFVVAGLLTLQHQKCVFNYPGITHVRDMPPLRPRTTGSPWFDSRPWRDTIPTCTAQIKQLFLYWQSYLNE